MSGLELEVPVYNINKGMNTELFEKSPHLRQYAEFVAKLREFTKQFDDFAQAVQKTVNHCIENNILEEFLKEQGGKIVSILCAEYDPELAKRYYAEEYAEERMEEYAEDVAKKLLSFGMPIEQISISTGLPIETIKNLE